MAKWKRVRKPGKFRFWNSEILAECVVRRGRDSQRLRHIDVRAHILGPDDSERFARWLARAIAWQADQKKR